MRWRSTARSLTATEPPPPCAPGWSRVSAHCRGQRTGLLSISDTSVPKGPTSHASLSGAGPASPEGQSIAEPTPSKPHLPDARAQRRQI